MQRNSGHPHPEPYGDLVDAIETRLRVACLWLRIDSEKALDVVESALDWIHTLRTDEQLSLALDEENDLASHDCINGTESCHLCLLRRAQQEGRRM